MKLRKLIAGAEVARNRGDLDVGISDLAYDSRKAGPGTLFFCVPGEKADGHGFAEAVVEAGAVGLVVERELDIDVAQVVVADSRAAMAPLAARFWRDPTRELRVVGVTGTNGKTTTAFLVREILEAAGIQCGLLGTVRQVVGGVEEEVERTTPEAIDLQATFRRMLDAGDRACAMEVSSHALALHRCDAIRFEVALFTNLTQDHLDFHGSMEDYFQSKRLLFETPRRGVELGAHGPVSGPPVAIVNVDDPYGLRLAGEFDCLTFSVEDAEADFTARDIHLDASGASFVVVISAADPEARYTGGRAGKAGAPRGSDKEGNPGSAEGMADATQITVRTELPGHFNVANALGAIAAATALGVEPEVAATGLAQASAPPGRFEPVDEGQEFAVVVDYAHTPDSLENVLRAARRLTGGRLIAVFGAGGDRDRDKRPKMGRAAAELADLAIVTSDNPRSEDPGAIVAEILTGTEGGAEVEVEPDRRAAIALALGRAEPGDTVVIAGKGHEQGQELENGRKVPFDDREVARVELRRLLEDEHPPAAAREQ